MSALARVLLQKNERVGGSDLRRSSLLEALQSEGAAVHIGHSSGLVKNVDTVIYSTDISQDNPELIQARRLGLLVMHRSDLLNLLMETKKPLLVTGTHGKTTTSSLLAHTLLVALLDPSFVIGGILLSEKMNGKSGKGIYFVAEADESDGSFLKTKAFGAIVTNLEPEHMNYWGSEKKLSEAFGVFFQQTLSPSHLFWCKDDPRLCALSPAGISYGFSHDADCLIEQYLPTETGLQMDLTVFRRNYRGIELALRGRHNALNGSAVFALALSLGVAEESIRRAFRTFSGTARRLEWIGSSRGIDVYDDYGHHPTEIKATLSALKESVQNRRLVVVFQAHRFSRVRDLIEEFSHCFDRADVLIVTEIYSAGEAPLEEMTSVILHQTLQKTIQQPLYFFERASLVDQVVPFLCPGDVVVAFGAGDVTFAIRELFLCL